MIETRKWMGWGMAGMVAIALTSGTVIKPMAEQKLAPFLQEQINTAIQGQVSYGKMHIGWDGTVSFDDLSIRDRQGQLVGAAKQVDVDIHLLNALRSAVQDIPTEALIEDVTIREGDVHAKESASGTWNVTDLVESKENPEPVAYRGRITLEDSRVEVTPFKGEPVVLQDADGVVNFKGYPELEGAASFQVDGETVRLRGSYEDTEEANFSVHGQTTNLPLKKLTAYMPVDGLTLTEGAVKDVALTVTREKGTYSYEGGLALEGVAGQYDSYTMKQGKGRIFLRDQGVHIASGSAVVNDAVVDVQGNVNLADPKRAELDLYGRTKLAPMENFVDAPVTGLVNADLHVKGSVDDLSVTGPVEALRVVYNGHTMSRMTGQLNLKDQVLGLEKVVAHLEGGSVEGQGLYDLQSGEYMAQGLVQSLPLGVANDSMGGLVTGTVAAKGVKGEAPFLDLLLQGSQVRYGNVVADALEAKVSGTPDDYQVDYFNALVGDGTLTAYGRGGSQNSLKVYGSSLPLPAFQDYIPYDITGTLTIDGSVTGPMDNPTVAATVSNQGGSIAGIPFDSLYSRIDLENGVLRFADTHMHTEKGGVQAQGSLELQGEKRLQGGVKVESLRIEDVIAPFSDVPMTGWVTVDVGLGGTLDNPDVKGYVHAWDGSLYGKLFSNVYAIVDKSGDTYHLEDIVASAYGSTVRASGTIEKDVLNINLLGEEIDLEPFMKDSSIPLVGYVDVGGQLQGTVQSPVFSGAVRSKRLTMNGAEVNGVVGDVTVNPQGLTLHDLHFNGLENSSYEAQGFLSFEGDKVMKGIAQVKDGKLSNLLGIINRNVPNMDGYLNGRLDIGGTLTRPYIAMNGEIHHTTVGDNELGVSTIDLSLEGNKLDIRSLKIPVQQGLLAAEGSADLDGEANIQIASNQVPVELLLPLTGKDIPLTGTLNFIVNVSGETRNPKVEFSSELMDGTYNGVPLQSLTGLGHMEDKVITVQQVRGAQGPYAMSMHGTIPLAALYQSGYLKAGHKNGIDLTLDANEADLGVLPLLWPSFESGTGNLNGKVHITGTLDETEARGSIHVKEGTLKIKGVKHPISNINGHITFSGQEAKLIASAAMGKGNMGLSGAASWKGKELTNYGGALQLDRVDVQHEYFKGPLVGEFYISEQNGRPTLTGDVQLDNTTISIPLTFEDSESSSLMDLDVTVRAGKNVRLYNPVLYDMKVDGTMHLGGTTQNPEGSGKFTVRNGTLKYLNNRFRIQEGEAKFIGGSMLPELAVQASSQVQNYRVQLNLTGPIMHMKLGLTSDPYLEERQIVSLLTFGRNVGNDSEINNGDVNALLAASLQTVAFGYVENLLKDNLGLDLVRISTGSLDQAAANDRDTQGNFNIQIGKYVAPDLMLTVSRGLNNDMTSAGFQYDISKRISVNGWVSSNDNSYLGGRWRYRF